MIMMVSAALSLVVLQAHRRKVQSYGWMVAGIKVEGDNKWLTPVQSASRERYQRFHVAV